jgi:aminopeptidase N
METQPKTHFLADYLPPAFLIDAIDLFFDLHEESTLITSTLQLRKNPAGSISNSPLVLDGEEMQLKKLLLNGVALEKEQFQVDAHHLTIFQVPEKFCLEIVVEINPQDNKQLSGLYKSAGNFCTQCESHGFRRITYFLDRPDVLTRYTTTIAADKTLYPVLLSNGNLVDSEELPNDRHWVKWEDPTYKPSYLFALVAGNLEALQDIFITQSGRSISLFIYVEPGKREQAQYAMSALKDAMHWDEAKYGREYDLDIYMIVAVSDFNFGAMENKGLNIFNDRYILVKSETATDEDFMNVLRVVAHEYFHNWSGNRVTVRDWFQITLKEGLTVFREHQFMRDMTSKALKRIEEARAIINIQFAQDSSPMAHPIYPDSYIEINNFYTVTVYEKGAEIIGMLHTLLGEDKFRKAMDLYFSRYDGHPVTVEEFVTAMEDVSDLDLKQFRRWYRQAGTPELTVKDHYDPNTQTYTLNVTQFCPPTLNQAKKELLHIPLAVGLLDRQGQELSLLLEGEVEAHSAKTRVLNIRQETEVFKFNVGWAKRSMPTIEIAEKPVPSLLRGFSAPVKLNYDYSEDDLIFLMSHDTDFFNRWRAAQRLATKILLQLVEQHQQKIAWSTPTSFIQALQSTLHDRSLDDAFIAEILTIPSETYMIEQMQVADVEAIHLAREWLIQQIALQLKSSLIEYYQQYKSSVVYQLNSSDIGHRRLKNLSLFYLASVGDTKMYSWCLEQFHQANNMTDVIGAMSALNDIDCDERAECLSGFYHRWHKDSLVIDKWFKLQALSSLPNTLEVIMLLTKHEAFDVKNPNRVRSLIGTFCNLNPFRFHVIDGAGYEFLVIYVKKIDQFNSSLAAHLIQPLIHWKKFDPVRQKLMKSQLESFAATPKLSGNLYEIVSRSLA